MKNSRVKPGLNDLESYCKNNNLNYILEAWDYSKNEGLLPSEVSYGSKKVVNWICEKGHSYPQQINAKIGQKQGCPFCSGQKVLPGYNDLATCFPLLAKEWSPNNNISPSLINPGSNQKYEWVCSTCGYVWLARVGNRTRLNAGCPACAGEVVIKGKNDLDSLFPQISSEWDYSKNDLPPYEYAAKSHKSVYWLCPACGYSYRMRIQSRTAQNQGCTRCAKRMQTSFPEQSIFYYMHCLFPDAVNGCRTALDGKYEIDIYIPSRKIGIEYDGARWHRDSHTNDVNKYKACIKKGIFLIRICEIQSEDVSSIADKVIVSNYNQGKKLESLVPALNDLFDLLGVQQEINVERDELTIREHYYQELKQNSAGALYPELVKEWCTDQNGGITLYMLSPQDESVKYSWKCLECGNVWKTTVYKRAVRKQGCRLCGYKKVGNKISRHRIKLNGSLQERYPDIAKEWDTTKNGGITPAEVAAYENMKRWWRCYKCEMSYEARVSDRTMKGSGCPYCNGRRPIVGKNDLATTHPELIKDWNYERNAPPQNYKAGSNKRVWWKCHICGYEWQTPIYSRAQNGRGCKECSKRKRARTYFE